MSFEKTEAQNHEELKPNPEKQLGRTVAALVNGIFEQLPPIVSQCLVDSNVVLTLAGTRGDTDMFIPIDKPEQVDELIQAVEQMNKHLLAVSPQIRFTTNRRLTRSRGTGENLMLVSVENLNGYEKVTKRSTIPGVIPFQASLGFGELQTWRIQCLESIETAGANGLIPPDSDVDSLMTGIIYGYPDLANLDFNDWLLKERGRKMKESDIPYTGIYEEAEPNFVYYPEHANDPAIRQHIKKAGDILEGFYLSEWIARLRQTPILQRHERKPERQ